MHERRGLAGRRASSGERWMRRYERVQRAKINIYLNESVKNKIFFKKKRT